MLWLAAGAALLAVLAVGPWAWVSLASRGHVTDLDDAPSAPVALVLGAGLNPDGSPSAFLAGRLEVAKALYDSGRARVILVSGDNRVANHDEPTAMRDWLVAHGVPGGCRRARLRRPRHLRLVHPGEADLRRRAGARRVAGLPPAAGRDDLPGGRARRRGRRRLDGAGRTPRSGPRATRREKLAAAKTVLDVVSGRDPVLGPVETSVQEALAASATGS